MASHRADAWNLGARLRHLLARTVQRGAIIPRVGRPDRAGGGADEEHREHVRQPRNARPSKRDHRPPPCLVAELGAEGRCPTGTVRFHCPEGRGLAGVIIPIRPPGYAVKTMRCLLSGPSQQARSRSPGEAAASCLSQEAFIPSERLFHPSEQFSFFTTGPPGSAISLSRDPAGVKPIASGTTGELIWRAWVLRDLPRQQRHHRVGRVPARRPGGRVS